MFSGGGCIGVGLVTERSRVRCSSGPPQSTLSKLLTTVCSDQLRLPPSAIREMSSSLPGVGYGMTA